MYRNLVFYFRNLYFYFTASVNCFIFLLRTLDRETSRINYGGVCARERKSWILNTTCNRWSISSISTTFQFALGHWLSKVLAGLYLSTPLTITITVYLLMIIFAYWLNFIQINLWNVSVDKFYWNCKYCRLTENSHHQCTWMCLFLWCLRVVPISDIPSDRLGIRSELVSSVVKQIDSYICASRGVVGATVNVTILHHISLSLCQINLRPAVIRICCISIRCNSDRCSQRVSFYCHREFLDDVFVTLLSCKI